VSSSVSSISNLKWELMRVLALVPFFNLFIFYHYWVFFSELTELIAFYVSISAVFVLLVIAE